MSVYKIARISNQYGRKILSAYLEIDNIWRSFDIAEVINASDKARKASEAAKDSVNMLSEDAPHP